MADDFPAAHSMDTTWFAIDRDGHVARFDSGEAGAVPHGLEHGDDYAQLEELVRLPDRGRLLDERGFRTMMGTDHVTLGDNDPYRIVVFVRDLAPIQDLISALAPIILPSTAGHALVITTLYRAAFAELHARDACVGCMTTHREVEGDDGFALDVAAHGVYSYDHSDLCENSIAGPYARLMVPNQPITADELPASVRDAATRFVGRFAELVELQPAEHWPCNAYSDVWLATDHKTQRTFDGDLEPDD